MAGVEDDQAHAGQHTTVYAIDDVVPDLVVGFVSPPDEDVGLGEDVLGEAVLGLVEGRRRFDQMSLPRFAGWGAVGGLLLSGIFVLATATLGMTTGVLPRWFNVVSYVFGVVLMLAPMVFLMFP